MDELKLEELKHELEGTNIHVSLVDGALEIMAKELENFKFMINDEKFLKMPVSNLAVDIIEIIELEKQDK